jgi:hypothetical protein
MRHTGYRLDGAVQVGALLDGDVVVLLSEANESGSVRVIDTVAPCGPQTQPFPD